MRLAMIAKGYRGLSQTLLESAPRHTHAWRREATTQVFAALTLISLGVAIVDRWFWPAADVALRYEREAVLQGQFWRLLTAHVVHADTGHLMLNMGGTVLIAALFPQTYRALQWVLVLTVSAAAIGAGLLLWKPEIQWYVGASGILHGALAAGSVAWWRGGRHGLALTLSLLLLGKLCWEQWQGALPLASGLRVIVDAHLYGAAGGAVAAAVILGWQELSGRSRRGSL
jgi:rhomboid family GlyGly-CTERM serine protease